MLGGLHIPRKAPRPTIVTGRDGTWQEALSPRLTAAGRMMVQGVGYPVHIDPHLGRLSSQVKPRCETTSPRTIPGIIHLSIKNAEELRRTPRSKEECHGSPYRPP
jgi:hypothetical protein